MFPADQYTDIYLYITLLFTATTAVLYGRGASGQEQSASYGSVMAPTLCIMMALFLGTRPISGVFVDMTTYNAAYEICSFTGENNFPDWAFSGMMGFFSQYFEAGTFFLACAVIYLLPLLWLKRVHGRWAFAIILAMVGSFSFYTYGVNVIRHGMASSLLIAAICNRDNKWLAAILAAFAVGMHRSMLAPIAALLAALTMNSGFAMWTCWFAWITALIGSWATKGAISDRLMNFGFIASDEKVMGYLGGIGNDKGGFRWDFIAYSITPLAITFALAGASTRRDPFYRVLVMAYLLTNAFWLLVIYAAYSDRFAHLSWCLLPWVIMYPFTPKADEGMTGQASRSEPLRLGWLSAGLLAHFGFTFFMYKIYYGGAL